MSPRLEKSLLDPVSRFIRERGFNHQECELQFYEYRIDLYAYAFWRKKTLAIELKLRDWKRAFQQALIYQLCADLVYLAMPEETCRRIDQEAIRRQGVGVIAVLDSGKCMQLIAPRKQTVVRKHYRDDYVRMVMEGPRG